MGIAAPEERTRESIRPGDGETVRPELGVALREFVSHACGARGFSTGMATFAPGSVLPYHIHTFSETITLLGGGAQVKVEGRSYQVNQFDCIHVPAGVAHEVTNSSQQSPMVALWAFASSAPSRELVHPDFILQNRGLADPALGDPETIVRFAQAETYELSPGAEFRDLFAGRFGTVGICGGYGRFQPGSSLPCHIHHCDESITIVEGKAICLVQGNRYQLSGCDTAFVPKGLPHRFVNESEAPMAMIWVYASTEPERTLIESAYCDGTLAWPGRMLAAHNTGNCQT
jgi:quercetin dioxygenase-like cupin family protein